MLITITDGHWASNEKEIRGLMRLMHQSGVTSLLLTLGYARGGDKHDHMIQHHLTSISEMPKAVSKVVAAVMRRNIDQHA